MAANFLEEGIQQAATARQQVSGSWADTWKNYAVNYALNKQANEDQLNLWNLMNEYNTPANQMKRYVEAGLNPNLIYSQGTPGNASGTASYQPFQTDIHPSKDRAVQIQQAQEIIGMFSNLAGNVANLIDRGLDVKLKQNQVALSNFERSVYEHTFPYSPGITPGVSYSNLDETLNPLSPSFDPLAYIGFQKMGQLPTFLNNFMTGQSSRTLQKLKADYQDYYNTHLLPKFDLYQQGKIDLQEIEKEMESYQKTALEMIPPELRGILEPLIRYISPFVKFIFKRSSGSFNHTLRK